MLLEKDLKKILDRLVIENVVHMPIGNGDLTLRLFDQSSKLIISTPVYFGGNFIPSSVRKCAVQKHHFKGEFGIKTSLSIDENKFQITLIYLDEIENINRHKFSDIIEEFNLIAEKWRQLLDENDRNDLVYVRSK